MSLTLGHYFYFPEEINNTKRFFFKNINWNILNSKNREEENKTKLTLRFIAYMLDTCRISNNLYTIISK